MLAVLNPPQCQVLTSHPQRGQAEAGEVLEPQPEQRKRFWKDRRQGDPFLSSRLYFFPVILATGPLFLHLHNTSVSGNSPSWLTPVLGTRLVKGDGVTGGPSLVCPDRLMYGFCLAEGVGGEGCFVCFELPGAFLPLVPSRVGAGQGEKASAPAPLHCSRWSPATPSPAPAASRSLCFLGL